MPITCICPACQQTLAIGEEHAGQAMRCPLCMALFQAPALPQNQTAGVGVAGPGPAAAPPPWQPPAQAPGSKSELPYGPVWGGVGGDTRTRKAPVGGAEWQAIRGAAAAKLAPGWHMVRRGLAMLPLNLAFVFSVFTVAGIILLFDVPSSVAEMVKLICVPAIIICGVLAAIGGAMCCLVPPESGARNFALATAGCLGACLVVFLLTVGVSALVTKGEPKSSTGLFLTLAYLPTLLLLLAGCIGFSLFCRSVALHLNHKRLGQSALVSAIVLGSSPVVLVILVALVKITAAMIGGQGEGKTILVNLLIYVIIFIDLIWFVRLARDVRRAVLRGSVQTTV